MYLCIDMRSFFASVECSLRGLNPLEVPLAVVDARRGDGALVMAATPKLKEYGVPSRCRLFDIPKDIFFIRARPRMKYYIYYAKRIHDIFLRYVSPEDCFTYSIDESFLKVDEYIHSFHGSPKAMGISIMNSIQKELGIYATCGAGDNMYLSKIALDILAKKNKGYFYLTEELYRKLLWNHTPLIDFWRIGPGISSHLDRLNIHTMKELSEADLYLLKREFGVLGEELHFHALGKDSTELVDILNYTPVNRSISRSQILFSDYHREDALICLLEMTYMLTIQMCMSNVDAKGMSFYVGYSKSVGGGAGKSTTFEFRLRDYESISKILKRMYIRTVEDFPVRSIGICFSGIAYIGSRQLSLFHEENERYVNLTKTIGQIHQEYGRNSVLLGISYFNAATIRYRNGCIGGHNGE